MIHVATRFRECSLFYMKYRAIVYALVCLLIKISKKFQNIDFLRKY